MYLGALIASRDRVPAGSSLERGRERAPAHRLYAVHPAKPKAFRRRGSSAYELGSCPSPSSGARPSSCASPAVAPSVAFLCRSAAPTAR
jgi:hypothetical protein